MSNDIDFNALLTEALGDRERFAAEAEAAHNERVNGLLKQIVLMIVEAANSDEAEDRLRAILRGDAGVAQQRSAQVQQDLAQANKKLTEAFATVDVLEATVAENGNELKGLREENQQLKTDKGRLENELKKAQDKRQTVTKTAATPVAKKAEADIESVESESKKPKGLLDRARERGKQALENAKG